MFRGDVARPKALADRSANLDPTYVFPDTIRGWAEMRVGNGQDRLFDPLRTEPRFIDFLKRIGFSDAR